MAHEKGSSTSMSWKWLIGLIVAFVLVGCVRTPKSPIPTGGPLHNPDSDEVGAASQQAALRYSKAHVPENLSQTPADGMVFWDQREVVQLNPDGSVYEYKDAKGNTLHLYNRQEKLFKWNNVLDVVGGSFKRFWFSVGAFFGARQDTPYDAALVGRHGGLGDGVTIEIVDMNGNLTSNADQTKAVGEAKAALQKVIVDGLGTSLEKHWLGATKYLEVRNDGLVNIVGAVGDKTVAITGELIKLTPYGAVNALGQSALKALVKEKQADGTIAATPTEVTIAPSVP